MRPTLIFDTFVTLFAVGLVISVATLVSFLVIDAVDARRSKLPRATLLR